jgi:hypothetical protein
MKSLQNVLESVVPEKIIAAVVLILTAAVNAEDIQQAALSGGGSMALVGAYDGLPSDINVLEICDDTILASATRAQVDLVRLSITNPASPQIINRYDGLGGCNAILAMNGVAAVVGGPDSNLRTFRVGESNPIELMGSLATPGWASRLARSGSILYVGGESGGVTVVDASDPENPVTLDQYNCNYVRDLAYGAGYLYVADGSDKILILDARNPSDLQLAGEYDLATSIVRYDNHMLVTRGTRPETFCVFSVTNPAAPVLLSTKYTSAYSINDIQVDKGLAYILRQWSSSTGSGLLVYDISRPTSPYLKASYDFPRGVGGECLAVDGLYTYVGLGFGGMYVLELLVPRITSVEPDFVPAGWTTPVMVYGSGFAEDAQVDISGALVTSTSEVSQTQMEVLIPGTIPSGLYDVKVTNPGGLNDRIPDGLRIVDTTTDGVYARNEDLFTTPGQPRASETCKLSLHLYRVGGTSPMTDYPVVFYEGNPDFNGTVIGTGTVVSLPAEGMATCSGVDWTPAYATDIDIYAVPGTAGVKVYRNIEVGASSVDGSPPTVNSVLINGSRGNQNTSGRNVTLQISATDIGSEVKNMWIEEDVWNTGMGYWQTVQKKRWQPYKSTVDWTLTGTPGCHYTTVWVSDAYGNISEQGDHAFINYVPLSISIAEEQAHFYNYDLNAGDSIQVKVIPTRGDPDLYIGTYDAGTLDSSRKTGTVMDSLDFVAPVTDWYTIDVYGFSSANYSISINGIHASAAAFAESAVGEVKPVPEFKRAGSGPPLQAGLPAAPVSMIAAPGVAAQVSDLVMDSDNYMPGDTVELFYRLENKGQKELSGTVYVDILNSAGQSVQLLSKPFSGLGVGAGMDFVQSWTNHSLVPRDSQMIAYVVSGSETSSVKTIRGWLGAPFFVSHIGATNRMTEIEWPSVAGRTYLLEMKTNLDASTPFTVVSNNIPATPPVNRFRLQQETPTGFLRVHEKTTSP